MLNFGGDILLVLTWRMSSTGTLRELYECDEGIEYVGASRTLYGKCCIDVGIYAGLPIYNPAWEELVPKIIEDYPVQVHGISCCIPERMPDFCFDKEEIKERRRKEIKGYLEWRQRGV